MSKPSEKPVVIVGAGISGLSLARLLTDRGIPVVVIEKQEVAGGLARSHHYGDFTFDIGPHRFHTTVPRVQDFILEVLQDKYLNISRNSLVRFKHHFYPWPIHPSSSLLKFPPKIAFAVIRDLMTLFGKKESRTFKDHIINMYGKTLYHHFFEGYSTKFLGITPELTHPDWAKTGIDRAIIDKRMQIHSLWQLILRALTSYREKELEFIYPEGGCGAFITRLCNDFTSKGGRLICGNEISAVDVINGNIRSLTVGNQQFEPSMVVWTGTLHSLMNLLDEPMPELNYLALVCFNLMLTEGHKFDFQWCYHGAGEVLFSRVSIPENFAPGNTPAGKRALCVEVTCHPGDKLYNNPEHYLERVIVDLEREELLITEHEIEGYKIERHDWAYPIYSLQYRDHLSAVEKTLSGYSNLIRGGRLGLFWYNNMDHCIEAAFGLAQTITSRLADGK